MTTPSPEGKEVGHSPYLDLPKRSEEEVRAHDLLEALIACSDELEKVWRSDGMVNANRYVTEARVAIKKFRALSERWA